MEIQIPKQLEKYQSDINKASKYIQDNSQISLKQVGKTKNESFYKELYLISNPFFSDINININHFKSEKDVYKMEPSGFILKARTIQAFFVYSASPDKLELNEDLVEYDFKMNIEKNLIDLSKHYQIKTNFSNKESILIHAKNPSYSETHVLDLEKLDLDTNKFYKYNDKYKQYIELKIKKIKSHKKHYIFETTLTNLLKNKNIEINSIFIQFSSDDHPKAVSINIHKTIKVKANSYKVIKIEIEKKKFKKINMKNTHINIVFD